MINYGGVWSDTWKEVSMQPRVLNEISKEGVLVDEVPRLLVWDIEESNKRTIRSHAGQKGQSSRKRLMRSQRVVKKTGTSWEIVIRIAGLSSL